MPLQRRGNLSRRSVSGDRRQSLCLLLHDRQGERQVRIRMDRRQRLFDDGVRIDRGRMKFAHAIAAALLLMASVLSANEIPLDQRRSGATFMGPDTRAMQEDDTSNPGML